VAWAAVAVGDALDFGAANTCPASRQRIMTHPIRTNTTPD
jgi:hypothetical protein